MRPAREPAATRGVQGAQVVAGTRQGLSQESWGVGLGERRTPRGPGCPARPLGALITESEQRDLAARLWSGVETCWHVLEGAPGRARAAAHDTEPGLLNDSDFSESGAWRSVQGTGLLPGWEGGDPLGAVATHGPPSGPDHLPTASPGVRASRKGFQGHGQPARGSPLTRNCGRKDRKWPCGSSPQSRCRVSPRKTPQVTAHGPGGLGHCVRQRPGGRPGSGGAPRAGAWAWGEAGAQGQAMAEGRGRPSRWVLSWKGAQSRSWWSLPGRVVAGAAGGSPATPAASLPSWPILHSGSPVLLSGPPGLRSGPPVLQSSAASR